MWILHRSLLFVLGWSRTIGSDFNGLYPARFGSKPALVRLRLRDASEFSREGWIIFGKYGFSILVTNVANWTFVEMFNKRLYPFYLVPIRNKKYLFPSSLLCKP